MSKKAKRKSQITGGSSDASKVKCFFITNSEEQKHFDRSSPILNDLTPGAMYFADWYPDCWKGADGHTLVVVCPDGHHWIVDSQASNCTMKEDVGAYTEHHRCWIRHGEPPNITVDKQGRTCKAGAGSIQTQNYHGRLIDGVFVP